MSSDGEADTGSDTGYGPNTKGTLSDAFGTNDPGVGNTGIGTGVSEAEQASIESQLAPDLSVTPTPEAELLSLTVNPRAKINALPAAAMTPAEINAIRDAIDRDRALRGAPALDRNEMEQGSLSPEQKAAVSAEEAKGRNAAVNDTISSFFGFSQPSIPGFYSTPAMAHELNPSVPTAEEFGFGTPSPFGRGAPPSPSSSEGRDTPLLNYGRAQEPQQSAPPPVSINTPVPLSPWDYQEQVWNGNQFTPAPLRRL